ncbi:ATP-binding protein [Noviherbaspirillum aerium]|uniref:ATP-binding protein n=1 Tax=Noviherbaspirillum aerium TaxID=2588497 RepID=UPI00124D7946|nr:ATP-binding protein [Noviherbaspirillum aerium]
MTIRQRITLLVVLMFAAICGIGGYAFQQFRQGATQVRLVTEGVVPSALASADLVSRLKDVQLATIVLASAPDRQMMEQAKEKLAASRKQLREAIAHQVAQAAGSRQKGLMEQAGESLDNYLSAIEETMRFKDAGKNELAQANLFGNVVQYQGELEQIVDTLRIEKNRAKDDAIIALNDNLATTTTTLSVVTLLAALILSAVGMLLYRRITGPISRMQAMMSEIAASQDFTRRVPVQTMDEIGRSIVAFNGMIEKIEESSAQVRQKTADIQAMLENMPQGILTVVEGVRVHPEYSAHLETILETDDIIGRNLMDLLFSGANLGADALAQIDAAVRASIGEDAMNFEFNQHLLVGEFEKTMADGRVKVLDLSWSPITDDTDTTVRLMLCVRDVTELRKLAAEAGEQKRKLEIIGEVLAVSQEKFHEFIVGSMKFVTENEVIIREHPELHADAVAQLFRNMHTIKGNARTYGLNHLTNVVHLAEQTCEELRKPRPKLAWDQSMMLQELFKVRDMVELYADINEFSLGRKGPGLRAGAGRYLMVDQEHVLESLHRLETVNTANLHELLSAHETVRRNLRLLGTETLAETLGNVLDSLPSLASELDKETPTVKIIDNGYRVRTQAGGVLKNVFMHLIRNAMDHGLEVAEVRRLQGKTPAGTIHISADVAGGMLRLELGDDGRGLALSRIRRIAADKGLIHPAATLSDEEVAQLIFRPGFSTAAQVTEISGRGVGMDAVQDFVRREHGSIEIQFCDDRAGADYRQFRTIVMLPAGMAVAGDMPPAALAPADNGTRGNTAAGAQLGNEQHAGMPEASAAQKEAV